MFAKPPLWSHQHQALDFVNGKPAAMLAMAMGTGKSRVAIDALELRQAKHILILCPSSVVNVWPEQIHRHGGLVYTVAALRTNSVAKRWKEARDLMAVPTNSPKVVVINYEAAWRQPFADWAIKFPWDALILDESHRLKAPGGVASRFAARLTRRIPFKLALTGTPMPHSPLDVYAQYRALDQSIYGTSFTRFRDRYADITTAPGFPLVKGYKNMEELNQKFYQIAFKVDADVMDLPEAMQQERYCHLGSRGKKVYEGLEADFYAEVEEGTVTAANVMVKALRLQQATSGYAKLQEDGAEVEVDDAKKRLLGDILEDLNEPVVVFCRFRHDLEAVHQVADAVDQRSLELSGRTNELEGWQNGYAPILAVQIQAGGVGIDLTRARVAIYYSLGLSLGDHLQSMARVHRPGQTRNVVYYYLLAENTIDVKIARALQARKDVIEAILAKDLTTR